MSKKNVFKPQKAGFRINGYIIVWVLLLIVGIVFTQALRNSVSYVFIIIVILLPVLDLIYVFIGRASVSAAFSCAKTTAEKNEPVDIGVTIKNRFILPLPFVEAELILPDAGALSSSEHAVAAPLPARGTYAYRESVPFPYKGEYRCGVKNIYVSSLFRFFRVRIGVGREASVIVLPRRLTIEPTRERYVGETSAASNDTISGTDSAEITEIKEYVPGDPMRNIHWKLSGKTQELMTKHFGTENGMNTAVIADAGRYFTDQEKDAPDINEYCGDAVCELALFTAMTELLRGRNSSLIYVDDRKTKGYVIRKKFGSPAELDGFLPYYAAAAQTEPADPRVLLRYPEDGVENDVVFITAKLDADKVNAVCETAAANRAVTLICFMPLSRKSTAAELGRTTEAFLPELYSAGVNVRIVYEEELNR